MASANESREALERDAKKLKAERDKMGRSLQGTPMSPFVQCKPIVLAVIALWMVAFCISPSLPCPLPGQSPHHGRLPVHGVLAAELLMGAQDSQQLGAVWQPASGDAACGSGEDSSTCVELAQTQGECQPGPEGWWWWALRSEMSVAAFLLGWVLYGLAVAWISLIASTFLSRFSPFLLLAIGLCGATLPAAVYQAFHVVSALHSSERISSYPIRTLHLSYWLRHIATSLSLVVIAQLPSFSSPVAGQKPAYGVGLEWHNVLLSLPLVLEVFYACFCSPSSSVGPALVVNVAHFACVVALLPFCVNFVHIHHKPMTRNEATEAFLAGSSADHLSGD